MKILCCQIDIEGVTTRASMETHQHRIKDLVRASCIEQPVELVLLPELSGIEYSNSAFNNLEELAIDLNGWLVESMGELARELDTAICFGMPRRGQDGVYISQVFVNQLGVVDAYYDKVHVAQLGDSEEKHYFAPGNHVAVVEVQDYRIGVVICYDMRFGEYISSIVQQYDVDIMLHPVAFARDGTFASWRSFVCTRALENQVYWLSVNRAGQNWGHSIICPPWFERESQVLEFDESEQVEVVSIDQQLLRQARATYPLRQDRLNDYDSIVGTVNKKNGSTAA